ncbi:hypothetical protein KCU95_g8319, partial [Aureobasidium melanogenum]
MTRSSVFHSHTNLAMDDEPQDDPGHTQGVDQVNIVSMEDKPGVDDQANISHPTPAPEKESTSSPVPHNLRTPQGNGQSIFSAITGQTPLQEDLASPTATLPQDASMMLQNSQDTPKLPCTPGPLAQPRRYGPGTGYEIRTPANMTPARLESRILPIGELITSHGNRTYTLWANEQQKPDGILTQVIITNVNSTTTFKSYSGVSRRSPLEVLDDFNSLLRTQGIALVSLNVVQDSFVAVVSTDKGWEQLREGILHVAR